MLVNLKEILEEAESRGFAAGAFNCASLESAHAAIMASERTGLPFVLQYAPVHGEFIPFDIAAPIMLHLARNAKTKVCVHLDHGGSVEWCLRALASGFTSVMLDFSTKPFEENLSAARAISEVAHNLGASVEAELGHMPTNAGDSAIVEAVPEDFYTKPDEAKRFASETGIDALAISFGTVHGVYAAKPKLSIDVISKVREATGGLPLVMHGGSGLTREDYRNAVRAGIRKINYYTYGAIAGGKAVCELAAGSGGKLLFHDVAARATAAMADNLAEAMLSFKA